MQKILGHHSILTTARYTHLSTLTDASARAHIHALMLRVAPPLPRPPAIAAGCDAQAPR